MRQMHPRGHRAHRRRVHEIACQCRGMLSGGHHQGAGRKDRDASRRDAETEAREIIGRAFSDSTILTIMQWGDDQVISMSLTELMELDEAMDVIADEMDYQETIADFVAGTRG